MLRHASRFLTGVGLLALAFGGAASTARADFAIEVTTGAYSNVLDDNGLFDTNPAAGIIDIDTDALNQDLAVNNTGYRFIGSFGAASNYVNGSGDLAALLIGGTLQRTDGALGSDTFQVVTNSSANPPPDASYPFPIGPALVMRSATSGNVVGFSAGDTQQFQSTFTDAASASTSSTNLVIPSAFQLSAESPPVNLGSRPLPFDLSSTLIVNLSNTDQTHQFNGVTTVRAIPEPGSIALLIVGGAGLVAVSRRRRAVA